MLRSLTKRNAFLIIFGGNMRNILVTGGAKGIGKAIIEEIIKEENTTILLHYNKSEAEADKLEKILKLKNITVFKYKADLSNPEEAREMVEYFLSKVEHIDVLINNAGISQIKLFTEITTEEWKKMMDVNINSMFYVTKETTKNMIHNKRGCIINISSIWGETGSSCEVHYSASKAAVNGFTKALAKELGPSNIRVNAIAPGFIETDMNKNITDDARNRVIEETPLEKTGKPEDIARCVKWLINDEFTTGQIISVNGGLYI